MKNILGRLSPSSIMNCTLKKQTAEKKIVFFRNDDVGLYSKEPVAKELINLTNLFIELEIPICHAVVPKEVNMETVQWLKEVKSNHPDLISIGQHGYSHINHGKGEFGGRNYQYQKSDIETGMHLMQEYLKSDFSYWFAVPWVRYDRCTKEICDKLRFKVFSGGVSPVWYARLFNSVGRSLNLNVMGFKVVSYHSTNSFAQNGFSMTEISVAVDIVEDYKLKQIKSLDRILKRFCQCQKHFSVIGFMLHHWVFDAEEKLEIVRNLLYHLKTCENVSFSLIDKFEPHG